MLGKIAKKSVGRLLGEKINDHVSIYVASGRRNTTPEEEVALIEERVAQTQARAIKFKVGGRMSKNADSMEGRSEGLIYLARKHFGDDIAIHADGNGSYDPPKAIQIGKMLEEINAYFYEEPCPLDYLEETKEVADALDIPLAFGEQETSMRRFRWLIENNAVEVLQPDIQYNGGFIRTTRVARMAAKAGIDITPHISDGISYLYVLHLASYTPNIGEFQEHKEGFHETQFLFTPPLKLKNGKIEIPDRDGLGLEFDKSILQKAYKVV
jgi:L-alanine-DL-glutamate epimerase-like enolase superfamily enzyme